MLKIRLSRTGKTRQPSFSILVQEHTSPVKGKFIEELGSYHPVTSKKDFKVNIDRIKYWISVGAKPSDTMAVLLKKHGMEGMDQYIEPRNRKRKKKGEQPVASAAVASAASNVSPSPAPQPQTTPQEAPKA
ncbi:30S ribosomal protein S16 [Candidatus Peregrinibacteria bacterium]|nr:30S ribosomal protein S16 [Candidatus Peregrinibacteria bacterium]